MGLFSRLFGRKALGDEQQRLLRELYGATRETRSGETVTWKTSLDVAAVLACVRAISDGLSTVPCKVLQKEPGSGARREAVEHPLHALLTEAPNGWQSAVEFRETLAYHVVLCGNAFVYLSRVRDRLVELIPIEPGKVTVDQANDFTLTYKVTGLDGRVQEFPQEAIWHVRGPSWNSWMGLEATRLAREAIGLSMATERSASRLMATGARTSGIYSVEGTLSAEQYAALNKWIERNLGGAENAGRVLLVDRNAKFAPTQMTSVDAQMLETRRFQIEEICRAFGVMPIMVGLSEKTSTYASAEQMFLAHAVHTVRPWHRRFEAGMRRSLLTRADREAGVYVKFFDSELMRGAAKDRAEFYARALGAGGSPAWMEINEVRGLEDMDEVPWGSGQPMPPVPAAPGGNEEVPADAGA